ncbi:Pre-rRNA-processing protein [Nymphaea thermarum]|nr:Pre-rRNA-processing protein [Nymphaea thermarum]
MDDNDESRAAADGATVTVAGGTRESVSVEAAKEEKARLAKAKRKRRLLKEMHLKSERGVCYMSRVPPQMDPSKLRQIMSQYGEVLRIYLVPEDPTARVRRKSAGGHRGEQFSEGWVEFAKKSVAKKVAHLLNGEQIGGKKRSKFYHDLWNIKYLSGFKWDHLTEEQARKHADREQKLVLEISAARKERDFYLEKFDQSRALSAMQERAKKVN